jgi:hypothetical protein
MKALPNIERSAFNRGEYIGYGDGVWRITRAHFTLGTKRVRWVARHRENIFSSICAGTLREISQQLPR